MELPFKYADFSNNMGRGLTQKEIKKIIANNKEIKMKYCCQKFESAIGYNEIARKLYPSGIEYYISFHFYKSDDEHKEQRIHYCPWCGKDLI